MGKVKVKAGKVKELKRIAYDQKAKSNL